MSIYLLPEVTDWPEWGRLFTDETLWRPVVERVWAGDEDLRRASGISYPTTIDAGYPGTCAVFFVSDTAVIKFFPPMVARDYGRELSVYRLIENRAPHLPALLGSGVFRDRIGWPYLVVSRLGGKAWRDVRSAISLTEARTVMVELGRVIRFAHDTPLPQSGSWPAARDWVALVESRLPRVGSDLTDGTALRPDVIAEIDREMAANDWFATRPCLLHADLTEDHLLLDRHEGRWSMTGLIDWADAEVGDPLYDCVALWFSICRRNAGLFCAFLDSYGLDILGDVEIVRRLEACTFLHRFSAAIINETLTADDQQVIQSLADLRQVLFGGLVNSFC